jgi:hypothetical protein
MTRFAHLENVQNLENYATPHQWQAWQAYCEVGSISRTAAKLNRNPETIRKQLLTLEKKCGQKADLPEYGLTHPAAPGMVSRGTSEMVNQDGEVERTWYKTTREGRALESIKERIPNAFIAKTSSLLDAEGLVQQHWVTYRPEAEKEIDLAQAIVDGLAADLPKVKAVKAPKVSEDLMTCIPMGDPHFGMYAWAEETGNDFNLDIARQDMCAAVDYLVKQAPPSAICAIINLGDFFHADNLEGKTTRSGNVLDMDTRLPKVIQVGVAALRQAIQTALKRHDKVVVINAIGNHDDVLSMALSIMLSNIYENEPRVEVYDQPTRRHYITFGKNLIGVTHGNQTKDNQLPGVMATERPQDWGETKYRTWFRGHHHQDKVEEFNGCRVEQFRTLAPGDAYAVGHGWLSGQDMKAIVYHREFGEQSRFVCSIDLLRSLE